MLRKQIRRALLGAMALTTSLAAAARTYTLPFAFSPSQSNSTECAIFDVNKDGVEGKDNGQWTYNIAMKAFKYTYDMSHDADDWLILPVVDFGTASKVKVSFQIQTYGSDKEDFEVMLGHAQTVEAMTVPVLSEKDFSKTAFVTLEAVVDLPSDGLANDWALELHATSPAFRGWFYINDIKIEAAGSDVTDKVMPGAPVIKTSAVSYLDYTATVTMPAADADGNAISGDLGLDILVDGKVAETRTAAAGADVDIALQLEAGAHVIGYVAVLDGVEGQLVTETVEAREHVITPAAPVISESKTVNLDYTATVAIPDKDTDGNGIDGNLTLKASVDGVVVKTMNYQAAGSKAKVELSLTAGEHEIAFTVVYNNVESAPATETVKAAEALFPLPFSFDPSVDSGYLIIDANHDGTSGSYETKGMWGVKDGAFVYYYHSRNQADDWVMLPMVDFAGATKVKVSFSAKTVNYDEAFDVRLGQARTIDAMTLPVVSRTAFNSKDFETFSIVVDVPESESPAWCLGIHALSEADNNQLWIKDIKIERADLPAVVPSAPVIAESAVVGRIYTATVTMPATDVAGADLTAEMKLNVFVDDELVETKEALAAGADVEISLDLADGSHTIGYQAVLDDRSSEFATEDIVVDNSANTTGSLPFSFEATKDNFDQCVVIDNDSYVSGGNEFGRWSYAIGYGFKYTYHGSNKADDWLILPFVDFGRSVKVRVTVEVSTEYEEESIEVWLGRERSAEAMTLKVIEQNVKSPNGTTELVADIELPLQQARSTTSDWAVGLHAVSPANHYNLYVKSVKVESLAITGIEDVEADVEADCEYYNLQGMRVEKPESGIYIVRRGSKVTKVIL